VDPAPDAIKSELVQLIQLEREQLRASRTPWFKQPAILIAALAFLVSVASTVITIENNHSQTLSNERQQLLTLVEDLSQVPQVQTQIDTTYKNNESAQLRLGGAEATDELIQAEEAAQLINALHGEVPSAAAYQVGIALADRSLLKEALHFYQIAIQRSSNDEDRANTYRAEALVWYGMGNMKQAFATISRAYYAVNTQGGFSTGEVAQNHIFTDLNDISSSMNAHACVRARGEYADAVKLTPLINKTSSSYTSDTTRELTDKTPVEDCV
jgi:tetratricopeptide (TPR) repeat protein